MDADGVLTDGRLFHFMDTRGRLVETKGVDSQDGIGLVWLARRGIRTGIISGRASEGLAKRARMLKMSYVAQGALEKVPVYEDILRKSGLKPAETAFVGDDLTDIPLLRRAGWGVAVANARPEVRRAARYVTRARGGHGAVREIAEMLLKAHGLWKDVLRRYEA